METRRPRERRAETLDEGLYATKKTTTLACGLLASTAVLAARSDWRQITVGHFHLDSTMRHLR